MREAGRLTASVMRRLGEHVAPGITTDELDKMAETLIREGGGLPAFKGYHGFPCSICASVDHQVVHGIPDKRILREGEILSIDLGALVDGYYGDMARTFPVGEIDDETRRLVETTWEALEAGVAKCRPGMRLYDVSNAVQMVAERAGFGIVREYVGHGIGREMHEEPQIPNYGTAGTGPSLKTGMVFAIEPMINVGDGAVRQLNDGWTVVTKDGLPSAHFENTVAITEDGPEILTKE